MVRGAYLPCIGRENVGTHLIGTTRKPGCRVPSATRQKVRDAPTVDRAPLLPLRNGTHQRGREKKWEVTDRRRGGIVQIGIHHDRLRTTTGCKPFNKSGGTARAVVIRDNDPGTTNKEARLCRSESCLMLPRHWVPTTES